MAEIEARHMSEFNLVLTAAGSGPYNLSGVQQRYVLDNPQYPAATFLPLGLLGWEPIYPDWFDDLPEVFLPPYDVLMPQLFDRTNTLSEIQRHLPRRWVDFMQPEFVQDLESNRLSPVAAAFRDNDLLSFRPRTPLTMYYCAEDELVSYFNTVAAWFFYKVIAQSPADEIAAVNLGPWGHVDTCLVLYALFAKRQLDAERNR